MRFRHRGLGIMGTCVGVEEEGGSPWLRVVPDDFPSDRYRADAVARGFVWWSPDWSRVEPLDDEAGALLTQLRLEAA
jgi:hypothetical protein